ncbi:DoxX family membrane protein, partial [Streptomyces sp. st170]|uniref:DoxX family membrane protein n=1 Tax=Streptomyces sp. st170 TaxID=1828058 RepID=UPI00211D9FCF
MRRPARAPYGVVGRARRLRADESGTRIRNPRQPLAPGVLMVCFNRRDLGLLALRVGTGAVLAAHGSQKLAGWFGGGGIQGTTAAMEAMGFHPPKHSAVAAGLGEAGGGALLALG